MKLINFSLFGLVCAVTLALSSCKKETKIERNLWKNGGEWTIESFVVDHVSANPGDSYTETTLNFGSLTFKKDGTGDYIFNINGSSEPGTFSYSNTEDKLTMTFINTIVFDLEWEQDNMTITHTDVYTNQPVTHTETYTLKKK